MTKLKLSLALAAALLWNADAVRASDALSTNTVPACCHASESTGHCSDKSLYQVESKWTTDGRKQIKLADLAGKPQVVVMFFSHCTVACPILLNDLKRINAALTPEQRARVGFTLVSFDTTRDTPDALAEYRRAWNLPAENWTLLSGSADDVLELAALLGVKYKPDADGQFAHSNVITLLDANGEIAFQLAGLDADPQEMVRRIEVLVK
jgi:protein SCO1/2